MPALQTAAKRHISFYGEDAQNPSKRFNFDVLCGDQPPTVVDGYAQWQTIPRPLRRALTLFQGSNPISLQVAVRFTEFDQQGSWLQDDDTGKLIEYKIAVLEWMAGESIDTGPSPYVYLSTFDGRGNTIPLIPFEYQPNTRGGTIGSPSTGWFTFSDASPWIVTALAWDQNPIRNQNGYRIRQDATVTVMYYQGPGPGSGPSRTATSQRGKTTTFISRPGADTAITIARAVHSRDATALAGAIRDLPQNASLHIRSIYRSHVPHGKRVRIPTSF